MEIYIIFRRFDNRISFLVAYKNKQEAVKEMQRLNSGRGGCHPPAPGIDYIVLSDRLI